MQIAEFCGNLLILQSMTSGSLEKDLIPQSQLWSIALGIGTGALDVLLFPPVSSEPVIHRRVPLDASDDAVRAVEDAIYGNPLLLNDFRTVTCAVPMGRFMILPSDVAHDRALRRQVFDTAHPGSEDLELLVLPTDASNAVVVAGVDPSLAGFLRRSFYNIRLTHPMVALINHTAALSRAEEPTMLVRLEDDYADVTAAAGKKLLLANRYRISAPIDAAYYVLATRKRLGLSPEAPLRIAGAVENRHKLGDILRPYLSDVADLQLPPRLWQAGTPALTAPLNLLLLHPSCA